MFARRMIWQARQLQEEQTCNACACARLGRCADPAGRCRQASAQAHARWSKAACLPKLRLGKCATTDRPPTSRCSAVQARMSRADHCTVSHGPSGRCVFAKHKAWQICHVQMDADATARRSEAPLETNVVTGYSVNFEALCFNECQIRGS